MAAAMPVIPIRLPRKMNSGTASSTRWPMPSSSRPTITSIGVDVVSVTSSGITITITDTGAGSDTVNPPAVSLSVGDSGAGVDLLPGIVVSLALADAGAGADALSVVNTTGTSSPPYWIDSQKRPVTIKITRADIDGPKNKTIKGM